ncbi:MAG: lipoyl(octanoyl) transferase LipB, partial [Desulfomonilaceae bacterium]
MKESRRRLEVIDWGTLSYREALIRQEILVHRRILDSTPDRLVLVEHPPIITIGRSGGPGDILVSENTLREKNIQVLPVDRGGKVTFHGPGQLVAYPIIKLREKDLRKYLAKLLEAIAGTLRECGFIPEQREKSPGLWVNGKKIASVGVAIQKWVTYHGLALNVNGDLAGFELIVPCGDSNTAITSIQSELGTPVHLNHIKDLFVREFVRAFAYNPSFPQNDGIAVGHPPWLVRPAPSQVAINRMD